MQLDDVTPAPVPPRYVPLRVHSHYALQDGLVDPEAYVTELSDLGIPAGAITDPSVLFGAVKFAKKAAGTGVQALTGADLKVQLPDGVVGRMTFFCQDAEGYR